MEEVEEEDEERDEGPVLDVDALRMINQPPSVGLSRGRGASYQPPPPTRFRPGAPMSRPPGPSPRGQRPLGPPHLLGPPRSSYPPHEVSCPPGPPRSLYPPQEAGPMRSSYPPQEVAPRSSGPRGYPPEIAPRLPGPPRGYPPERRHAPTVGTDPYYQRYPGYGDRYDHYYPTPSSSGGSSSLEARAVINYDHQSLTKDADEYGAKASSTTESTGARHEFDLYGKRAATGYEEERRASAERSQTAAAAAAADEGPSISSLNIDLVKAAIVSYLLSS